jgi:peptidoglycan hydrolase CwlO-like protein
MTAKEKRKLEEIIYKLVVKLNKAEEEAARLKFENSTLRTTIEDLRAEIAALRRRLNER